VYPTRRYEIDELQQTLLPDIDTVQTHFSIRNKEYSLEKTQFTLTIYDLVNMTPLNRRSMQGIDFIAKWYVRDGEDVLRSCGEDVLRSCGEHVDDGDSEGDVVSAADAPVLASPSVGVPAYGGIPRAVGSIT
jgi:hypothetical protein